MSTMVLAGALLLSSFLVPQQVDTSMARPRGGPEFEAAMIRRREVVNQSVETGLQWLATEQRSSGAWTGIIGAKQGNDYRRLPSGASVSRQRARGMGHMGVTSLAGIAFLAGGHLPGRGRYGQVVQQCLDYVLDHVADNGFISDSGTRMYSHAFATLFLAEIYGMSASNQIKAALERAVNIIVDCQNHQGAWRYNAFSVEADLSVTVCQLQALRAARNIGIQIPSDTIERAVNYVVRSRKPTGRDQGLYYYKLEGRSARRKLHDYSINAAALTALLSAGVYDEELHTPALSFLAEEYPYLRGDHFYYWYGNYYAAQAFFHYGGERFLSWYDRVQRDLLNMQTADGSWRNRVGPGDEFSTAVACILLQIPKQYLPIFQR